MLQLLPILLNNWKPICAGLGCALLLLLGYKWGSDSVQAEWDKSVQRGAERAAESAAIYEKQRVDLESKALKARKELAHAISKDSKLSGCVATPDFVRIYNSAITR